jgi:non-heme chloroperoxidase
MAYLDVDSGKAVYYEHYRGRRCTVLLIHGWAVTCRVWDGTIALLRERGHGIVAFDHRGCGRSDKDFDDQSIPAIAADVVALADRLRLDRVVLNGWSMGGAVAVESARRLQDRCAGLVLTCAATPRYTQAAGFPHGGKPEDVRALAESMRADRATFFHGLTQAVCAKPVGQPVLDWMWSLFMQSGPGVAQGLVDLADLEQREVLKSLSIPILNVIGSSDAITPPAIGEFAAAIEKDGTLVRLEGSGHAPFMEDFTGYHAALGEFLDRCAP